MYYLSYDSTRLYRHYVDKETLHHLGIIQTNCILSNLSTLAIWYFPINLSSITNQLGISILLQGHNIIMDSVTRVIICYTKHNRQLISRLTLYLLNSEWITICFIHYDTGLHMIQHNVMISMDLICFTALILNTGHY